MIKANELIARYESEGIKRVKLGFTDIDGVLRGKYISFGKFKTVAAGRAGFCDCVLGWDVDDQLYDNARYTGWHTAFPDATFRIDLTTERRLLDENSIPFFLIEFTNQDGDLHPICPRSRLKHVLGIADEMGFCPRLAFEYEFFIFNETAHSAREKNYLNTASALIKQSVQEMEIFVEHLKGKKETVKGLAGLGDLYVSSGGGRNSLMGSYIGQGMTFTEAKKIKCQKLQSKELI